MVPFVLLCFSVSLLFWPLDSVAADDKCLDCHADEELMSHPDESMTLPDGVGVKLPKFKLKTESSSFIEPKVIRESVHGDLDCQSCHADVEDVPHVKGLQRVDCGQCHDEVQKIYDTSLHGKALVKGDEDAPLCQDCHGSHAIRKSSDRLSPTYSLNLPKTCARCHADTDIVARRKINIPEPYKAYERSVHGRALNRGLLVSAVCSDCHGSHDLKPARDPNSPIYRENVPKTCSKCHYGVYKTYQESTHGQAVQRGVMASPVCTDCHGEHEIMPSTDPASTVYAANISKTTCPRCHDAERINKKYGLSSKRVTSYQDSFHGLVDKYGSTVVANCASCHGVHDIRSQSDPKSSINAQNLPKTCGKCHPGATANFAKGSIHLTPSTEKDKIVYFVQLFYILLIFSVVGLLGLHNFLDYINKLRENFKKKRELPGYVRLTLNERIQHILLLTSFFVLVITGFALKFPDAWWTLPFHYFDRDLFYRGLLHRMAGIIMTGLGVYHLSYIAGTERGRRIIREMMPKLKDLQDAVQQLLYYFGLSAHKARFARFSYIEKMEYLALIWGTVVMVVTGLMLWFEGITLKYIPKWGLDVAEVVHYYEAWLAFLTIIIWHLYYVIVNPDASPMNWAWLSGRLTEHEMEEEHPLELEEIKGKEAI